MPTEANAEQIIYAIASLWKLSAVLAFIIITLVYRNVLTNVINRIKCWSLKTSQGEISVDHSGESADLNHSSPQNILPTEATIANIQDEIKPEYPLILKMHKAFWDNDMEKAEQTYNEQINAESNGIKKLQLEMLYNNLRYSYFMDSKAINRLNELTQVSEIKGEAFSWLGSCYEKTKNYNLAASNLKEAVNNAVGEENKACYMERYVSCLIELKEFDKALDETIILLRKYTLPESKAVSYKSIAKIQGCLGNDKMKAIALEKALEFAPEDSGLRFDAAFSQNNDLSMLSFFNYHLILEFTKDHVGALNNIGVECNSLGLPIKSIDFFKKAKDCGNSLAASNLAFKLIAIGFAEEAKDILSNAQIEKDVHENVYKAITQLSENKTKESQKWNDIITQATQIQNFLWQYAEACYEKDCPENISGYWLSNENDTFSLDHSDKVIHASWTNQKGQYKLQGTITRGCALFVKYSLPSNSLLDMNSFNNECIGIVNGSDIRLLSIKGNEASIIKFTFKCKNS